MVIKTYLDKFNTIIEESKLNTGLNPIGELIYGAITTRMLIHFDVKGIKEQLDKNGIVDYSNIKHTLKITNCGMINNSQLYKIEDSAWGNGVKLRASSFDLIFFLIPQEWDEGKGYDYSLSFTNQSKTQGCDGLYVDSTKLIVVDGCNWYQARNGYLWEEEGIYNNTTLSKEYDNFATTEGSPIVIARQHFDKGWENINVDLSKVVNKFLNGELTNYGIGIAFTPMTELNESVDENYVGFFTNHTNTFFEPYLETEYDDVILDDRNNFVLDKVNRLYLYANIGGFLTNLDELPTCTINEAQMDVKQASEGIYYIELMMSSNEYDSNIMFYDIWDNLKYKGADLGQVELDFVTKSPSLYFNIGNGIEENKKYSPIVYGIKYDEKIMRGDKRKITIQSNHEYSRHKASIVDNMQYRLYIKDGQREINVIDYQNVNRAFDENYFVIDTNMLLPQRYYVDIKYTYNLETIQHSNIISFDIVDDLTEKYLG